MDSAGRVLRVLRDCELFHMEAALTRLRHTDSRIRSESLQLHNGKHNADTLETTDAAQVLALSDHKRIARLVAALHSIVSAYDSQETEQEEDEEDEGATSLNRNLVCTVAGAAMMQSLKDCTVSRTNCCVWGPQADKLHLLLDWMVQRESDAAILTRDYVRRLLLEQIQPTAEKQDQLTACLTIFELLQRRHRKLPTFARGTAILCLLGDRAEMYLSATRAVVERGTIRVGDSRHVKLSKLALIALETLVLLCEDIAVQYMTSNEEAKKMLVVKGLMRATVECIRFVLAALRRWHMHSKHRLFLDYALEHLQSYATPCSAILSSTKEAEGKAAHGTNVEATGTLDVLCWHWIAAAPLLCTRTDTSCSIKKTRPSETLTSVLKKWAFSSVQPNAMRDYNAIAVNPEVLYAQLRYVCIAMDSMGGVQGQAKTFGEISAEMKARFVFFFAQGLSVAGKRGDEGTVLFILKVLRTVLLSRDIRHLLSSQNDEQALLSQLLLIHDNSSAARGVPDRMPRGQTELEFFVADFIVSRELCLTEILRRMQDAHTNGDQGILSLVRTFLYRLDKATAQTQLHKHYRTVLTPGIVGLAAHETRDTRQRALSCLSSLDVVSCVAELCGLNFRGAKSHVVTSVLGYLLLASTRYSLEVMVSWFIDACQFGNTRVRSISEEIQASPHKLNDVMQLKENTGDETQEVRNELLSLCFGPNGWAKHVQSASTRSDVLRVLIQKVFDSPRDAVLLRMLREFVMCGWVDNEVFKMVGRKVTAQMMTLPRLSEECLDDESASAVTSIEGLLFSRLAPLLVLRMIPRDVLGTACAKLLPCGREDLDHLNERLEHQLKRSSNDPEMLCVDQEGSIRTTLFCVLARSIVDPLEFKEVKMVATECLAKFPPPQVLPFVLAYLVVFLREEASCGDSCAPSVVAAENVPDSCGLVTAKLMVYYLNRVFSEDDHANKDEDIVSKALVVLVRILGIPCTQLSMSVSDSPPATDIQRGCIDCIALILVGLSACDSGRRSEKGPTMNAPSLISLLMEWTFDRAGREDVVDRDADTFTSRMQELMYNKRRGGSQHKLSPQARVCLCNVFLSAISRAEDRVLAYWKSQGLISRITVATGCCTDDDVAAGGFQIIFALLYKSSEVISMEDKNDVQLLRMIFDATIACLKTTECESIAMNGLKVIGALIGKFPGFVGTLVPVELQQLIDRCLIKVRDLQLSPAVSTLAHSLLQAMAPP
ncbi:unnamed protein product [Hyaloperonospora brassicae]|uniref:Uncharacterized protein n=1 Tax=Hyaloperonospora brassicae TaxID=162125 RepID=A0AAV0UQU8_HYABA|nr:unnamed protein product [Hyaloperonospora brassicae]